MVVNGGAQYSKACEGASLPWVQIPPPPPLTCAATCKNYGLAAWPYGGVVQVRRDEQATEEVLPAPTALLGTKFYVPRPRPGVVLRPRLSERLDRGTTSKLTLVSAPAGFGKTTLLTEWLAAGPAAPGGERLAAWLSLDRGDNDPASFWAYVIAALR